MRSIEDQAWDATLFATKDQLDEVEAARTAFKVLQRNYFRDRSKVYKDCLRAMGAGEE